MKVNLSFSRAKVVKNYTIMSKNFFKSFIICDIMLFLCVFWQNIIKLIEVSHAHLFHSGTTGLHVGIGVVVGDMGQTNGQSVGHAVMGEKPTEVVDDQRIVLPGILQIDDGVDILDVHYPLVHQGKKPLQMAAVHIQTCLDVDTPARIDEGNEFFDEGATQARFSATESHATASGKKIEVVDGQFLGEFVGGHLAQDTVGAQTLGVEAIAAA